MKTRVSILLIWMVALLYIGLSSCSKDEPDPEVPELSFNQKLQKVLDEGIQKFDGKGISLAIIFPDGEIFKCVSGISHDDIPINPDMLFSAGSITKMFTATTILQYVEENKFNLDDSIYHWFPDYEYIDSTIKIRQMLNHTSGIYNVTENQLLWDLIFSEPDSILVKENVIRSFNLEPYFPKGTDWRYSNTAYFMLRMLIEEISGTNVSSEYRSRLLNPNNLNHTYCAIEETLPANTAHGWIDLIGDDAYDEFEPTYFKSFYSAAGGGIFCTAEDLAMWGRKLFIEKTVISQAMLDQMLNMHSPCDQEPQVDSYGLGVCKFNPDLFIGYELIGHGGNPIAYAGGLFYMPDYGVCIGIMDNTEYGNTLDVIYDILDLVADKLIHKNNIRFFLNK